MVVIRFHSARGPSYVIQSAPDVVGPWSTDQRVAGTGGIIESSVAVVLDDNRFVRVVAQ